MKSLHLKSGAWKYDIGKRHALVVSPSGARSCVPLCVVVPGWDGQAVTPSEMSEWIHNSMELGYPDRVQGRLVATLQCFHESGLLVTVREMRARKAQWSLDGSFVIEDGESFFVTESGQGAEMIGDDVVRVDVGGHRVVDLCVSVRVVE